MKTDSFGLKIYTTCDVEAEYGISATTVVYWCQKGFFPAKQIREGKSIHYEFLAIDFALFLFTEKAGKHRKAVEMVPVGDLTVDPTLPGRAKVYSDTVDEYAAVMKNGDTLPPIIAARLNGRLVELEGAHRHQASIQNREGLVPVTVLDGLGYDDAFRIALNANRKHGRQLNSPDKRSRVLRALQHPAYAHLSSRALADLVGTRHNLIAEIRRELMNGTTDCGKPPSKRDDAITPARIAGKIRGQLRFLAHTHPAIAASIAEILNELDSTAN